MRFIFISLHNFYSYTIYIYAWMHQLQIKAYNLAIEKKIRQSCKIEKIFWLSKVWNLKWNCWINTKIERLKFINIKKRRTKLDLHFQIRKDFKSVNFAPESTLLYLLFPLHQFMCIFHIIYEMLLKQKVQF